MGRQSVYGGEASSSRSARHQYTIRNAEEDLYYIGALSYEQNMRIENLEHQGEIQRKIAEDTQQQVHTNADMISALLDHWNIQYP